MSQEYLRDGEDKPRAALGCSLRRAALRRVRASEISLPAPSFCHLASILESFSGILGCTWVSSGHCGWAFLGSLRRSNPTFPATSLVKGRIFRGQLGAAPGILGASPLLPMLSILLPPSAAWPSACIRHTLTVLGKAHAGSSPGERGAWVQMSTCPLPSQALCISLLFPICRLLSSCIPLGLRLQYGQGPEALLLSLHSVPLSFII